MTQRLSITPLPRFSAAALAVAAGLLLFGGLARADHADEALAAFERGDYGVAAHHWTFEAEQGDALAQYHLGMMYAGGFGVQLDEVEALVWLRLAAKQGYPGAQEQYESLYESIYGAELPVAETIANLRKAAQRGDANAQTALATRLANGRGVAKDVQEAEAWLLQAAAKGHTGAQRTLASLYATGVVGGHDHKKALVWFFILQKTDPVALRGRPQRLMDHVINHLSDEDRKAAEQAAKSWLVETKQNS